MDYEAIAVELLKIQAKINRLRANQEMDEFARGEIFALSCLHESGGRLYPKDLSRAMAVSSARVAVLLNHMEQKNLICRLSDETDSRKTVVEMTALGEALFLRRQKEILQTVVDVLEDLGEEDAEAFLRIRKKMLHE